MTDLVTDAAIDIAQKAMANAYDNGCDCSAWIDYALEAAAPLIAAQALRQARDEIDRRYPASKETGWVSIAMAALDDLADELEGNNK